MSYTFSRIRRVAYAICIGGLLLALSFGLMCPQAAPAPSGDGQAPLDPPITVGNRPPRATILSIVSPDGDTVAEQGELVTITFTGEDGEDNAVARVFMSLSPNPTTADQEIPIASGFIVTATSQLPPGDTTSNQFQTTLDTINVDPNTYYIFVEIDDRTFDMGTGAGNRPVRATYVDPLVVIPVSPEGTKPLNSPPELVFVDPLPNLGLASLDEVTIRYIYADVDAQDITADEGYVTVTLLLDKDQDPTNDDINNPGDPQDPDTNIIILPSAARQPNDPTFDGDPPPPDDPNNPPVQPDSLEVRTNPRQFGPTAPTILPYPGAPIAGELKEYRFVIDFSQIPVRTEPYYIRATITDGIDTVHTYAVGSLTISSLADGSGEDGVVDENGNGVVDVAELGFRLAGARFQGFSEWENLGTDFVAATDLDLDGVDEFMIASRFASPRNRFQSGASYLLYGRRKIPFPPDTDNDGLPDGGITDENGNIIDFPEPPDYLQNPYDARYVGRFGGVISINSVNSFFRGTIYGMPESHEYEDPPPAIADPDHPFAHTSGLTSIARVDMTRDGIADLVFGLPFISGAWDFHDDDPADGCGIPYVFNFDPNPNAWRCTGAPATNDDLWSPVSGLDPTHQGLVIMVDGTNDINVAFNRLLDANLAGQHDPDGPVDDDGVTWGSDHIPTGMRFRGGWFDRMFTFGDEIGDQPTGGDNGADDCARATVITEGLTNFDTTSATTDGPDHDNCEDKGDDQINQDIWWQYTATCTGSMRVEMCIGPRGVGSADFDTRLAVYDTCDCEEIGDDTLLACSDDRPDCASGTSDVTVPVVQGSCYLVRVGGYTIASGTGQISLTCSGTGETLKQYYSDAEYGRTVARLPDFDNLLGDELIISSPGFDPAGGFFADGSRKPFDPTDLDRGMIQVWLSHDYLDEGLYGDEVFSLPSYIACPANNCTPDPSICLRCFVRLPAHSTVLGEQVGDRFGYASAAGDFNQDGTQDVLAGAPGADRNGLVDCGVVYVLATPQGGFGDTDLSVQPFPRLMVTGTHGDDPSTPDVNEGDRFGEVQSAVQDINEDGIDDIAFAAEYYDDDTLGADVGYVGVIFGNRPITGELGFFPEDVATPDLPGVRFLGTKGDDPATADVNEGTRAGHDVASAGDFNGDGVGDLLITSPGEIRVVAGQQRYGVAYLIFGGRHLINKSFNLSQVGTPDLPGIVFVGRLLQPGLSPEEDIKAVLETVGGLGDIDGDGFDDIAIGAPRADFVNLDAPTQRRPDAGEVYLIYGSNYGTNKLGG